jgi:hypothetical protein
MKIAVVLPSRGNPGRLQAVLMALDHLSSGRHEIAYHLIVDADDRDTLELPLAWARQGVVFRHGGDPAVSHFNRINKLVRTLDADAVSWFADDVFPLAMHWDALIANGIDQGLPAFAWMEITDPDNMTYPILSKRWLDAVGYMFPEYFPFWFVDTWIMEVYELAFADSMPIVQNLPVGGRRGGTRGMHDLEYWFRFFAATHPERERDARRLADALAVDVPDEGRIAMSREHHKRFLRQLENVDVYEQTFGADSVVPSVRYLRLKAEADRVFPDIEARRVT